jgi:streptogramin lyase
MIVLIALLVMLVFGRSDEGKSAATRVFRLPGPPAGLVVAADRVWVVGRRPGALWALDPASSRQLGRPLIVGGTPARVAIGARGAWVAEPAISAVVPARWRPRYRVYRPIELGGYVADVVLASRAVWVADPAEGVVRVLQPGRSVRTLHAGANVVDLDANERWVVAAAAGSGTIARFDARRRQPAGPPIRVGGEPVAVAVTGDDAWVAGARDGSQLTRVDLRRGTVAGPTLPVCRRPTAVAADGDDVYILCRGDRRLAHVSDGQVSSRTRVGDAPVALALDPRHVWVADAANHAVMRLDR